MKINHIFNLNVMAFSKENARKPFTAYNIEIHCAKIIPGLMVNLLSDYFVERSEKNLQIGKHD